jgi:hypothetical protein
MLRASDRGTCTNTLPISRLDVEARVLDALETKLLRKDFFDEFCHEFTKEMNRPDGAAIASKSGDSARPTRPIRRRGQCSVRAT